MMLGEIFLGVISDLLGTLLYQAARSSQLRWLAPALPQTQASHRAATRAALRQMPFIYRDLATDIINDYVEVELQTISITDLTPAKMALSNLTTSQRIKERKKLLLLGNAGMGKTTFLRHIALSLLEKKRPADFLLADKKLLPFYVPLKAVDNTSRSPILEYLNQTVEYLSGTAGIRRLNGLARKGRAILLLDGYDESYIPPSGDTNYLFDELGVLFGAADIANSAVANEYLSCYRNLQGCRIWLSSRKEFYIQNRLSLDEEEQKRQGPLDFVTTTITGLSNRTALVHRIFDLYRSRNSRYDDILSEEELLQLIDQTGDGELKELSNSPLFLTVLCYLYVKNIQEPEPGISLSARSMSQLVQACIELLLTDLDEDKVRDLSPKMRRAYHRRRMLYTSQKKLFLGYFANLVLATARPVFTRDDLVAAAKEFFRESTDPDSDIIRNELASPELTNQGFLGQLLNQGLFTIVERTGPRVTYDFPHRRFREVLAAQYLNHDDRVDEVFRNIEKPQYAEFIYVFFSVSHYQNKILDELLDRSDGTARGDRFGIMVQDCLERKPAGYDASPMLQRFLEERIRDRRPYSLPREVLRFIRRDEAFLGRIARALVAASRGGDLHVLTTASEILAVLDKDRLRSLLVEELELAANKEVVASLIWYAAASGMDLRQRKLDDFRETQSDFILWCFVALSSSIQEASEEAGFWRDLIANLTRRERWTLFEVALADNPRAAERWELSPEFQADWKLELALMKALRQMSLGERTSLKVGSYKYCLVRPQLVRTISLDRYRDRLRGVIGKLIVWEDFHSIIPSRIREIFLVDDDLINPILGSLTWRTSFDQKLPHYFK
jgi:energy-coupling factor transporter ATP-binding protein EcfA2